MEKNRIAHLTWDDVINYDHGMRLGRFTFDEEGNRLLPDATLTERAITRRYNWLVSEAHRITVKGRPSRSVGSNRQVAGQWRGGTYHPSDPFC